MPQFEGVHEGYRTIIRQLRPEDVADFQLGDALGDVPWQECVAVLGEDLGVCLAAVVHAKKDSPKPLLWSDSDGKGTPIPSPEPFADAVMVVSLGIHPVLHDTIGSLNAL